jgi:hypothetical protein
MVLFSNFMGHAEPQQEPGGESTPDWMRQAEAERHAGEALDRSFETNVHDVIDVAPFDSRDNVQVLAWGSPEGGITAVEKVDDGRDGAYVVISTGPFAKGFAPERLPDFSVLRGDGAGTGTWQSPLRRNSTVEALGDMEKLAAFEPLPRAEARALVEGINEWEQQRIAKRNKMIHEADEAAIDAEDGGHDARIQAMDDFDREYEQSRAAAVEAE